MSSDERGQSSLASFRPSSLSSLPTTVNPSHSRDSSKYSTLDDKHDEKYRDDRDSRTDRHVSSSKARHRDSDRHSSRDRDHDRDNRECDRYAGNDEEKSSKGRHSRSDHSSHRSDHRSRDTERDGRERDNHSETHERDRDRDYRHRNRDDSRRDDRSQRNERRGDDSKNRDKRDKHDDSRDRSDRHKDKDSRRDDDDDRHHHRSHRHDSRGEKREHGSSSHESSKSTQPPTRHPCSFPPNRAEIYAPLPLRFHPHPLTPERKLLLTDTIQTIALSLFQLFTLLNSNTMLLHPTTFQEFKRTPYLITQLLPTSLVNSLFQSILSDFVLSPQKMPTMLKVNPTTGFSPFEHLAIVLTYRNQLTTISTVLQILDSHIFAKLKRLKPTSSTQTSSSKPMYFEDQTINNPLESISPTVPDFLAMISPYLSTSFHHIISHPSSITPQSTISLAKINHQRILDTSSLFPSPQQQQQQQQQPSHEPHPSQPNSNPWLQQYIEHFSNLFETQFLQLLVLLQCRRASDTSYLHSNFTPNIHHLFALDSDTYIFDKLQPVFETILNQTILFTILYSRSLSHTLKSTLQAMISDRTDLLAAAKSNVKQLHQQRCKTISSTDTSLFKLIDAVTQLDPQSIIAHTTRPPPNNHLNAQSGQLPRAETESMLATYQTMVSSIERFEKAIDLDQAGGGSGSDDDDDDQDGFGPLPAHLSKSGAKAALSAPDINNSILDTERKASSQADSILGNAEDFMEMLAGGSSSASNRDFATMTASLRRKGFNTNELDHEKQLAEANNRRIFTNFFPHPLHWDQLFALPLVHDDVVYGKYLDPFIRRPLPGILNCSAPSQLPSPISTPWIQVNTPICSQTNFRQFLVSGGRWSSELQSSMLNPPSSDQSIHLSSSPSPLQPPTPTTLWIERIPILQCTIDVFRQYLNAKLTQWSRDALNEKASSHSLSTLVQNILSTALSHLVVHQINAALSQNQQPPQQLLTHLPDVLTVCNPTHAIPLSILSTSSPPSDQLSTNEILTSICTSQNTSFQLFIKRLLCISNFPALLTTINNSLVLNQISQFATLQTTPSMCYSAGCKDINVVDHLSSLWLSTAQEVIAGNQFNFPFVSSLSHSMLNIQEQMKTKYNTQTYWVRNVKPLVDSIMMFAETNNFEDIAEFAPLINISSIESLYLQYFNPAKFLNLVETDEENQKLLNTDRYSKITTSGQPNASSTVELISYGKKGRVVNISRGEDTIDFQKEFGGGGTADDGPQSGARARSMIDADQSFLARFKKA